MRYRKDLLIKPRISALIKMVLREGIPTLSLDDKPDPT